MQNCPNPFQSSANVFKNRFPLLPDLHIVNETVKCRNQHNSSDRRSLITRQTHTFSQTVVSTTKLLALIRAYEVANVLGRP